MKRMAIIWDSMTGGSKALAVAAADGAQQNSDIKVQCVSAQSACAADLLESDGYLFVFPENLSAISGAMKAYFDRVYYPCLGQIEGRPFAIIVCAGSDGSNAVRQAERIATGWRLKKIAESIIVCTHAQTPQAILAPKTISDAARVAAGALGAAMAEGLTIGLF